MEGTNFHQNAIYFTVIKLTKGLKNFYVDVFVFVYHSQAIRAGHRSGSLGIAPTRNCTHFLKIEFVVARGGFYSYYIHQGNKSEIERKL